MTESPPEWIGRAELDRFLDLTVRGGWPIARLPSAEAPDRRAVLAVYALYLLADPEGGPEAAARSFLSSAGSFLSGTPSELAALARAEGWIGPDGLARAAASPGFSARRLALEVEFAENLRRDRREQIRRALQRKNSLVNAPRSPEPAPGEDERFMREALLEARRAGSAGEVPVGAVLVSGGEVIGRGRNAPLALHDPTAHAEVQAIRAAGAGCSNYRLSGCTLYVTLEPCLMCAGAIAHARLGRVVYGAPDPKAGAFGGACDVRGLAPYPRHLAVAGGVLECECAGLLRDFFANRRRSQ
ncbi:tRNA adenosine(34) deaminase TadA [Mesosutterella sp. OilRF-GAM-744-9]|uniref:tRNA-specific adenosine deaminase n=1 Tax=Mesosutterella porci TaxID=2915351 RepID=A0ABS9MS13_9BURK|nr:tRNA adenosine(34) deaminase TadA [Mesosutterella sp. oilRF-744-WT-GAM-9]MCG5031404.1 tRNA adenosine(34) deaminase TadA [Mesosutterella sp. oilRF-744-WT-GAM-9]